jgi:lysine 2,3-aminomutase
VIHIRTGKALLKAGFIEEDKLEAITAVTRKFSVSLTSQVVDAINFGSPEARRVMQKQFVPSIEELNEKPMELSDPIGDKPHEVVRGVIHRYPDRCLLMPIETCPVYCRFCFRRENVGKKKQALTEEELLQAFCYIREHPEIWEVILSGGDPLILKPKTIREILVQLDNIPHVEVVRLHTRVPIVDSLRVTKEMVQALKINKAVYVIVHVNHPSELTELVKQACASFVDAGIPMLSQTVLLKDINDTPEVMGELMRALVKNRIKPYYLHQGDLAKGTSHFRTTIKKGQELMKALRGHYSGLCQPTYMLDIPGGHGKIPIETSLVYDTIEDYQGNRHEYADS